MTLKCPHCEESFESNEVLLKQLCPLCDLNFEGKAEPADCRVIIEMHRPSGIKDRKAYAVCESCGSLWMDQIDQHEQSTGLTNVA